MAFSARNRIVRLTIVIACVLTTLWLGATVSDQLSGAYSVGRPPIAIPEESLSTLKSPIVTDHELTLAIAMIQQNEALCSIANDVQFPDRTRAYAVFQILRNSASPGMSLRDLRRILRGATWIHPDRVFLFPLVGGHVPVQGSPSQDSIFSLIISPKSTEWAVYVSLSGKNVTALELTEFLRNERRSPKLENIALLDIWPKRKRHQVNEP